jgi:hypothetical protein
MASLASNVLTRTAVRKPVESERDPGVRHHPVARQAFGSDVVGSNLSPRAQLGYRVLVDHLNRGRDQSRPYDGQVFLTDERFAVELGGVSKRQVQRIRSELLAGGWICLPKGDAGGRGNSTIWYHLHPDGRSCGIHETTLKQRAAAELANERRAETRNRRSCQAGKDDGSDVLSQEADAKDDQVVFLSSLVGQGNDDSGVIVFPERMTETPGKDDKNDAKDDKTGVAYKEELFQELIPELKSTTTTGGAQEFPPDLARLMDEEVSLDDGALRRLWQEARRIVPDATPEEIRLYFHQRALAVYRNRKLENPTGLMLTTVRDWFPQRRVLDRRKVVRQAEEEMAALQKAIADQGSGRSELGN